MQKIIVASGDKARFEDFARILETRWKIHIVWVSDMESVLKKAVEVEPDMVVVDQQLSGVKGVDLIKQIMMKNAFINTALASDLSEEDFHHATEGLGIAVRISTRPAEDDVVKILNFMGKTAS